MRRRLMKVVVRKHCALVQNVGTALAPDDRSILLHFELTGSGWRGAGTTEGLFDGESS